MVEESENQQITWLENCDQRKKLENSLASKSVEEDLGVRSWTLKTIVKTE